MKTSSSKAWPVWIAAAVAVTFGVLTILSGGRVLFGGPAAQEAAGNAVSFVLWFNFLSGFVYVLAGVGLALGRRWGTMLAILLAVAVATVFVLFGVHVFRGGAYEMRTLGAMTLRLTVWIAVAAVAARHLGPARTAAH